MKSMESVPTQDRGYDMPASQRYDETGIYLDPQETVRKPAWRHQDLLDVDRLADWDYDQREILWEARSGTAYGTVLA